MKKLLVLLVAIFSVFSFAACGGKSDTIKIGSTGPLSGEASIYGQAVKKGLELAIEEINKEGIKIGEEVYKFKLVDFINDEAKPDLASGALGEFQRALGSTLQKGIILSGYFSAISKISSLDCGR